MSVSDLEEEFSSYEFELVPTHHSDPTYYEENNELLKTQHKIVPYTPSSLLFEGNENFGYSFLENENHASMNNNSNNNPVRNQVRVQGQTHVENQVSYSHVNEIQTIQSQFQQQQQQQQNNVNINVQSQDQDSNQISQTPNQFDIQDVLLDFFSPIFGPTESDLNFDENQLTPLTSPALLPNGSSSRKTKSSSTFSCPPPKKIKESNSPAVVPRRTSMQDPNSMSDIRELLSSPMLPPQMPNKPLNQKHPKAPKKPNQSPLMQHSPYMDNFIPLSPRLSPSLSPSQTPIKSSPSLRPLIKVPDKERTLTPEEILKLTSKSNYQNLLDGSAEVLGHKANSEPVLGVGVRKSTHKNAEQKRRDMMKVNYETLRELLFDSDKSFSKSDILKKANEELRELRNKVKELENENTLLKLQKESH